VKRRVVITGVGAITPLGIGADTLVDRWTEGKVGIEDGFGRASEFKAEDFLSKKEARRADRFAQFAIVASDEAVEQAGWAEGLPYDSGRIASIVGTGIGGIISLEEQQRILRERGPKSVSPLAVPLLMGNAAAAAVAMRHGLHGEAYGAVAACAAGAHAVGSGTRLIENGDVDAVVTGGAEAALTGLAIAAFKAMGATSRTGICRPFDVMRDGFVMGEGAGILILEDAEGAERRGAEILGEIRGYAATSDAHHLTAPEPSGRDAARAIELALEDAGLAPEDVDYVNAHGTSTTLNDRSETEALKRALGEHAWKVPISSTKSTIGHLFGAAGAVEAIATLLALRREIIPPTLGLDEPEEGLDLDYVPGSARPLARRENGAGGRRPIAISNSFGFGGHNVVLCLAPG
jgi:3-oxoacyl-[acyl-carrier-protein] synthase II